MTAETRDSILSAGVAPDAVGVGATGFGQIRTVVVVAGLTWSIAFIVVGLAYRLQMYADGSIFSYAIAVQDAWMFHWRNISGRLFVYLFSSVPAEAYVGLTGDARGGIAVYGLLQFSAPLLGLAATFAADRSEGRVIFAFACASTACLCPLVFGFPTELWMSHTVFWPALALCHDPRPGAARTALVFVALLALVLTHGGGLIFAAAILATLLLRGSTDLLFLRTGGAVVAALAAWATIKAAYPPGPYFASIIYAAALNLIDPANLTDAAALLLGATVAGYGLAFLVMRRLAWPQAQLHAVLLVALALVVYWLWLDQSLNADDRYPLRLVLLLGTPALGALAAAVALAGAGDLRLPLPRLRQFLGLLSAPATRQFAVGALALVMLVHAVENAKFVAGWETYKATVRALAMGTASDPEQGDARFVSSARIPDEVNRLSWFSTTPYLSVLVAPQFAPQRLVVDPNGGYFWLSCSVAKASEAARRAIPKDARRLIRKYSCLHR